MSTSKNPGQYKPGSVDWLKIMYESMRSSNSDVFLVLNLRANKRPRLEKAFKMFHSPVVRKCVCVWKPPPDCSHRPSSHVFHAPCAVSVC